MTICTAAMLSSARHVLHHVEVGVGVRRQIEHRQIEVAAISVASALSTAPPKAGPSRCLASSRSPRSRAPGVLAHRGP